MQWVHLKARKNLIPRPRLGLVGKAVAASLVVMVAFPTAAFAHRLYEGWIDVWTNGPKCLNEKVTQDHGDTSWGYWPNGYWMTETKSEKETTTTLGTISCSQDWDRPSGYLKGRVRILKYNSSKSAWALCFDSNFIQSNVTTAYWRVKATSNPDPAADPPCGDGLYKIRGNSSLLYNGNWVGGELNMSESETLS